MSGVYRLTRQPNFVQIGNFTLHGGQRNRFKFDCDALTDEDWVAIAAWLASMLPPFASTHGIPTGGEKLAKALRAFADPTCQPHYHVICDDVLTTGGSTEHARSLYAEAGDTYPRRDVCLGAVFIARGPCPSWVTPLLRAPGA